VVGADASGTLCEGSTVEEAEVQALKRMAKSTSKGNE
jgi:hypothetical protein